MIKVEIVGDTELVQKLQAIEPKVHDSLLATITRLSIQLQANIKSQKLSGQVLNTRTGTLRRSINQRVEDTTKSITGIVGIGKDAQKYGVMHEFGLRKVERVSAHLRKIKQAFGRPIPPMTINVSGHSRAVNYPERSFMRTALADMKGEIMAELSKAVKI